MRNTSIFAVLLIAAVAATGCVSSKRGDYYSRDQARQSQTVQHATVHSVRPVVLEGTKSNIGTAAGGVVGGVAGSAIGDGTGQAVAAVLGAIVGGVAGAAAEEAATREQALEIIVSTDDGRTLAIVQGDAGENFQSGERVLLIGSYGNLRVTR